MSWLVTKKAQKEYGFPRDFIYNAETVTGMSLLLEKQLEDRRKQL